MEVSKFWVNYSFKGIVMLVRNVGFEQHMGDMMAGLSLSLKVVPSIFDNLFSNYLYESYVYLI